MNNLPESAKIKLVSILETKDVNNLFLINKNYSYLSNNEYAFYSHFKDETLFMAIKNIVKDEFINSLYNYINITDTTNNRKALFLASIYNKYNIMKKLLEKNIKLNYNDLCEVLNLSYSNNNFEIIKLLLKYHPTFNNPILIKIGFKAALYYDKSLVELLKDKLEEYDNNIMLSIIAKLN